MAKRLARSLLLMYEDYATVASETLKRTRRRPVKSTLSMLAMLGVAFAWKRRPDHASFTSEVVEFSNEISMCSEKTRSKRAQELLKHLILLETRGGLRCLNIGPVAVMVERRPTVSCFQYCSSHVQEPWWSLHKRTVDVGVCGRWLMLRSNMTCFDVCDDT